MKKLIFVALSFFVMSAFTFTNKDEMKGLKKSLEQAKQVQAVDDSAFCEAVKHKKYNKVKTVTNKNTTSFTVKKLTKGKIYYAKVRSYKTVDGKKIYGNYSSVKTVKISN